MTPSTADLDNIDYRGLTVNRWRERREVAYNTFLYWCGDYRACESAQFLRDLQQLTFASYVTLRPNALSLTSASGTE